MYKNHYIILYSYVIIAIVCTLTSCGQDRWAEYKPYTAMDEWMDSVMRADYLWYDKIPSSKTLNYFNAPATFLSNAKYSSDYVSHVDTVPETTNSYGISTLFYQNTSVDTQGNYNAVITHVDSDSPAARAGLKRGDWIIKVGDQYITPSNKSTILTNGTSTALTMGICNATTNEGTTTYNITESGTIINIESSKSTSDDPINYYATIGTSSNKKIGYLVYNSFKSGTNDIYNNELRTAFTSFKSDNVSDVIIDLRYNKGGDDITPAQLMASMLVQSSYLGKTFVSLKHSSKQSSKDTSINLDNNIIGSGANLNLSKVYIITSSVTAQMSEVLITALQSYMNVYLIGTTTSGYIGVTNCYAKNGYPYSFHPVTCLAYNASGNTYSTGIAATTAANETATNILPFGNTNEVLLAATLKLIDE